jgi:hypothetical protein
MSVLAPSFPHTGSFSPSTIASSSAPCNGPAQCKYIFSEAHRYAINQELVGRATL